MKELSWPEKLARSVRESCGEEVMSQVVADCGEFSTLEEKAEWAKRAVETLDRLVPDERTRIEIMTRCACQCAAGRIAKLREEYRRVPDIDRLLDLMHGNPFLRRPIREGHIVYITKVPRDPAQYSRAASEQERRRHYCHCDQIRASPGPVSRTYCYCGAGWCQHIFEGILARPVQVEVVSSVLEGDDCCRFAVYLPQDLVSSQEPRRPA